MILIKHNRDYITFIRLDSTMKFATNPQESFSTKTTKNYK